MLQPFCYIYILYDFKKQSSIGNQQISQLKYFTCYLSLININQMKIVLVYKQEIKLYSGQLTYDILAKFTANQFQLAPASLQLTFQDDEKDNISIHSNDDLEVMQAVFQGKQYTRITVEGTPANLAQTKSSTEEVKETKSTENSQAPQVEQKYEPKVEEEERECRRRWGRGMRGSHSRGHESPRDWSGHKKEHMQRMKGFFNEVITKMVDERINNMLPILKEKILKGEELVAKVVSDLIHNGTTCKACNMSPINGIRYKCPTCADFNLCEKCEQNIPHDHPLLKIRKPLDENQDNQEFDGFRKMFKRFFKGHRGHHGHRHGPHRDSSSSREKFHRRGHQYHKKIWGLSAIFGGQPEEYIDFAEKHDDLRPKDTYKKFAEVNGIPEEEFKEKFTTFRTQKLSKCFGNPPEKYRDFVAANLDLTQKDLMHALFDQGIEKRENKRCGWGRRFNFNQSNEECQFKGEKPCFMKDKTISKEKKEEKRLSKERRQKKSLSAKKEEIAVTESLISEPKPLDTIEVRRAKGGIIMNMVELFGPERTADYMKFIDKHFALGEEQIIDLWIKQ